jgi:hypothetical protein
MCFVVEGSRKAYESNTSGKGGSESRDAVHGSCSGSIGNWGASAGWCSDNASGGNCGGGDTGGDGTAAARARIDSNGP